MTVLAEGVPPVTTGGIPRYVWGVSAFKAIGRRGVGSRRDERTVCLADALKLMAPLHRPLCRSECAIRIA